MRIRSKFRLAWRTCAAALLLCAASALQAQTDETAGDPPDRVARLSWLEGDIGLLPSGAQAWGEASLNRPLTGGDRLSTSAGARAELELDGAAIRLDGGTDLGILALDDTLARIELTEGTLNLTVRQLGAGQNYEIDTPTVALVVDRPGSFRVDVDRDGQATRVTAFDGSATAYGQNDAQRPVLAGRSYRFADPTLQDVALETVGAGDEFDAWCDERARRYVDTESSRYVSEDVIGYQDLDRYGQWQADPEYGTVWYPAHVDADWAPYRNGHWAWVGPWGWTWIDDAPWGFAPYHYGRWAWRHQRWGWVPGPRTGWRPVYAPALVAFVGGRHWNVSIGSGAAPVGWFPLAPGEVYNPWYHGSRGYYARINGTRINGGHRHGHHDRDDDRIDRHYRDWRRGIAPPVRALHGDRTRGFTAVTAHDFANARRVQRHRLPVDARKLADARVLSRSAAPRPTPQSLAPRRPPHARPLPVRGFRRDVVARHAPRALDRSGPASHAQPHHAPVPGRHAGTLPTVAHLAPAPTAHTHPLSTVRAVAGRSGRTAREPVRDGRPGVAPLRSAHAAPTRRPGTVSGETVRPRSRVSFISSAQADRARLARSAPRLPQVPRLERADGRHAPAVRRPVAATGVRPARMADVRTHPGRIEAKRWQRPMAREAASYTRPRPTALPRPPHRDPGTRASAAPRFHRATGARPAQPVRYRAAPAHQARSPATAHGRSPAPRRFDPRH